MKFKIGLLIAVVFCVMCFAQEKINLLLVDVGTIDTVAKTEKFLSSLVEKNKSSLISAPKPSDAEAIVDPELQKVAVRINWETGLREYYKNRKEAEAEKTRRVKVLEGLRNATLGSSQNRLIVLAKDYLGAALDPYSEFINLVDRSEASLSEVEKVISEKSQEEVAPATLFITVTLADEKKTEQTVPVGNTIVKRTTWRRDAVYSVRDFNNVRVKSGTVTAEYKYRQAAENNIEGIDASDELIKDAMKKIGEQVGKFFVREYTVSIKVPKKFAEEVSDSDFELYMDRVVKKVKNEEGVWEEEVVSEGTSISPNEPFQALAISHTVTVVSNNEQFVAATARVSLSKSKCKASVSVKKLPPPKAAAAGVPVAE